MQTGIAASSISSTIASAMPLFSLSKPTMKPAVTNMPARVDLVHAVGDAAARILLLAHLHQRLGIRAFDADEHADEIRLVHQPQQFVVVGEIERGLGGELERIIVRFEPRLEVRQECLHRLLVADQIVVDEIDMAAIAERVERIEFRQHLRRGLGARHPAVELDDVAEFAGERTAARELHADIEIAIELQQIEARDRRLAHIDLEFLGGEHALARAGFPGRDEIADDVLDFAQHLEIRLGVEMRNRGRAGPADGDRLAARCGRDSMISSRSSCWGSMPPVMTRSAQPISLSVEFLDVAVEQAQVPRRRQHRRDRDQAERRGRIAGAENLARRREVPECLAGEARIDQQNIARARRDFCIFVGAR